MPTPHIEAKKEDIAPTVITAGDPERCKYIADKYLKNVSLVNSVRGMNAYTGEYKGKKITVFPVGMGMPSIGIYSYELYKFYDVENIIRVGTSGSLNKDYKVLDTVLLEGSYTESNFAYLMNRDNKTHLAYANEKINSIIEEVAEKQSIALKKGYGLCNEVFDVYLSENQFQDVLNKMPKDLNIIASEMEAFALFYIASLLNKKASCLLTIVDSKFQENVVITSEDRAKKLDNMIILALETCLKL